MPTLDDIEEEIAAVHLLGIAPTKVGKSTYAAEAAIDGFELIYIDGDNGLSAINNAINSNVKDPAERKKIRQRIHYFAPDKMLDFTKGLLRSRAKYPFLWVPSMERSYAPTLKADDDTPVWYFNFEAVPNHFIFCLDSWTTICADALQLMRVDQQSPLLDGGSDQSLYGEARASVLYLTNVMQRMHCHSYIQAHPTRYEIYEKPQGMTAKEAKQSDMRLIETITVPVSTSRPHGLEMGGKFNHIGNLDINGLGAVEIDFTRKPNRVGGGPPNKKAKTRDLTFRKLVEAAGGPLPENATPPELPWFAETTVGVLHAHKGKLPEAAE